MKVSCKRKAKGKHTHNENGQKKTCCNANKDIAIAELFVNQRRRKWEIAATLVFVCTSHWNF